MRPEVTRLLAATLPRESLEVLLQWALAMEDAKVTEEVVQWWR